MHVEPQSPRFILEPAPGGLRAVVPSRRNWFVFLFLSAWLVGWAVGEVQAARELVVSDKNASSLFLAAWLAGWTIGGAFAAFAVLWQLAGREIISVGGGALEHRIEILGIGRSRVYNIADIKDLRATTDSISTFKNQADWLPPWSGPTSGSIAFDYGSRTIRLASGLEEAEAKMLVSNLASLIGSR